MPSARPLRVAVSDGDGSFVDLLAERSASAGWQLHRLAPGPLDVQGLLAAKLNALVVEPDALGPRGRERLPTVCALIPQLAVVVYAESSSVAERVAMLRGGVDDWIAKPCHIEELVARVEAVSRRGRTPQTRELAPRLRVGALELHAAERLVLADGRSIVFTRREFDLLHLFVQEAGKVLDREAIYQRVWGYTMPWGDRSVDVFVRKLRAKLGECSPGWRYIHTYHRLGYRFEAELTCAKAKAPREWEVEAVEPAATYSPVARV